MPAEFDMVADGGGSPHGAHKRKLPLRHPEEPMLQLQQQHHMLPPTLHTTETHAYNCHEQREQSESHEIDVLEQREQPKSEGDARHTNGEQLQLSRTAPTTSTWPTHSPPQDDNLGGCGGASTRPQTSNEKCACLSYTAKATVKTETRTTMTEDQLATAATQSEDVTACREAANARPPSLAAGVFERMRTVDHPFLKGHLLAVAGMMPPAGQTGEVVGCRGRGTPAPADNTREGGLSMGLYGAGPSNMGRCKLNNGATPAEGCRRKNPQPSGSGLESPRGGGCHGNNLANHGRLGESPDPAQRKDGGGMYPSGTLIADEAAAEAPPGESYSAPGIVYGWPAHAVAAGLSWPKRHDPDDLSPSDAAEATRHRRAVRRHRLSHGPQAMPARHERAFRSPRALQHSETSTRRCQTS